MEAVQMTKLVKWLLILSTITMSVRAQKLYDYACSPAQCYDVEFYVYTGEAWVDGTAYCGTEWSAWHCDAGVVAVG
jgi:hypothetical protein